MHDEIPLAKQYQWAQPERAHDFYLTNNESDYHRLLSLGHNTVLVDSLAKNDGSLSIAASNQGIRYLNIEVALGNHETNTLMFLDAIHCLVPSLKDYQSTGFRPANQRPGFSNPYLYR